MILSLERVIKRTALSIMKSVKNWYKTGKWWHVAIPPIKHSVGIKNGGRKTGVK